MTYVNDSFSAGQQISSVDGTLSVYWDAADPPTRETNEPSFTNPELSGGTLWYRWTAPATGTAQFTTDGSVEDPGGGSYDTFLEVFTGDTITSLTRIAYDDDSGVGYNSSLTFDCEQGSLYHIRVRPYGSNVAGTIHLHWTSTGGGGNYVPPVIQSTGMVRYGLPGQDNFLFGPNDDSSVLVDIGFPVTFGNASVSKLILSNNGYVLLTETNSNAYFEYTPTKLDVYPGIPMIAAFFADVDTRLGLGEVRYGNTTVDGLLSWVCTWTNVGYYKEHGDKRNQFQIIIRDIGSDNIAIEFNYDYIRWETGDASDTWDGYSDPVHEYNAGFGGFSARMGLYDGQKIYYEYPASGTYLGLIDSNLATGLVYNSNIGIPGRFRWGRQIGKPFTAGVRKPPSQRNNEHIDKILSRAVKSMIPGTLEGRVRNAAPTNKNEAGVGGTPAPFQDLGRPEVTFRMDGDMIANVASAPYRVVDKAITITGINCTLADAGSTATTVKLLVDGGVVGTVEIPAGVNKASAPVTALVAVGGIVQATVTVVGTGAQYLAVQVRVT